MKKKLKRCKKPKLTVLCLAYNHEKYIKKAIESFFMQKTNFDYEVLIYDDASTDKTGQIIKEYKKKYPNKIKTILQEENYYSKGLLNSQIRNLFMQAGGKYIAICEGDDYWIDSKKLQLQVDFMDKNPKYTVCFHPVKIIHENDKKKKEIFPKIEEGKELTLNDLLRGNFIQTNSVLYRNLGKKQYMNLSKENFLPGDWYLHIYHAKHGKIKMIDKIMAVYNQNENGIWADRNTDPISFFQNLASKHFLVFFELLKLFSNDPARQEIIINAIAEYLNAIREETIESKKNIVAIIIKNHAEEAALFIKKAFAIKRSLKENNENLKLEKEKINAQKQNFYEKLEKINSKIRHENKKLERKMLKLSKNNNQLKSDLSKIQSAKFYKLWQFYCKVRDGILKRKKDNEK